MVTDVRGRETPTALARRLIDEVVLGSPVATALALALDRVDVDDVALTMAMSDELTTVPGVIHGGAVATLIDTAGAAACASGVDGDDVTGGATTHLQIAYLGRACTDLRAAATVVHRTRATTHTDVVVSGTDGRVVARGQVTSRIFYRR
ncbi:PaaI family thioesterase [Gordonia humi]